MTAPVVEHVGVSCALEVFVATALLHTENPGRSEFTIQEIVQRAEKENITGESRAGVRVHASQHCVANKPPSPGKHLMLFATGKHTRRLLLPGDEVNPERRGSGKIFPERGEMPERYLPLLDWARKRYGQGHDRQPVQMPVASSAGEQESRTSEQWLESLLEMEGLGKKYWEGVDPDEYVRKLREGWE
jgi:hypothetical protein